MCGGTSYLDVSGTLSYGDPDYGNPDYKPPCPRCGDSSSTEDSCDGCLLFCIAIWLFLGLGGSLLMWLLGK